MSDPRRAFRLDREVVRVAGPESEPYLQGQLSQDVLALADGATAWSWLLAPNGKVDALVRVTRLTGDEWLLDTDRGWGEAVRARLDRFKLRTKADITLLDEAAVVAFRGAGWERAAGGLAVAPWPGVGEGYDLVAPDGEVAVPDVEVEDAGAYEPWRIAWGIPRMGAELDERTIPAEAGIIGFTVSFSKGCYTGQELVARIDSRGGNVPRHLRGLRATTALSAGDELHGPDGAAAGVVTSAARAESGGWVGLGYVKRAVGPEVPLTAGKAGAGPVEQVVLGS